MTDKMSTKIKLCEWFGHRDESTGPEPGAEDPQSWFFLAVLGVAVVCYLPTVIEDAQTYRAVVAEQHACCGFVSESWFERPVTYALVDE